MLMTLAEIVRLGWSWRGPKRVTTPDGTVFYEMRIAELPDFYLAAPDYEGVMIELRPALGAFIASYLDRGDDPPLPPKDRWSIRPTRKNQTPAPQLGTKVSPSPDQTTGAPAAVPEFVS